MPEIKDWHTVRTLVAAGDHAVLDLRRREMFLRSHLAGSINAPLGDSPPAALPDDLLPTHLLPPRHRPLLLIGADPDAAARVKTWLADRGRSRVEVAVLDWFDAPGILLESGDSTNRLWRPPAWLSEHARLLPESGQGPVVDLGCGNGRAAVWLAERGYRVCAVDRYDEALRRTAELAAAQACSVTIRRADLTDAKQWPSGPWSVVTAFRFLHRPLLRALPTWMRPGGVVVVRTFRWLERTQALPRRQFCLEPGELEDLFGDSCWRILASREDEDDDGRPAAGIVARYL